MKKNITNFRSFDRVLTPLELLNLYYTNGTSTGNRENKLWQKTNYLLSWDNIIKRGYHADLAPFLYYIITKSLFRTPEVSAKSNSTEKIVPRCAIPFLKICYQKNLFRNMILLNELKLVTEIFDENSIKVIPLKGGDLAENVYEDIGCRPMGDLDILIKDKAMDESCELLIQNGYKSVNLLPSNSEIHHCFKKEIMGQQVIVELHNRLVKKKFRKNFNLNNIFELNCFSFYSEILYYCWHTVRHGVARIIWLCDIAESLRNHDNKLDWEHLLSIAADYNIKQEAIFVFYILSSIFDSTAFKGCPIKPGVLKLMILQIVFQRRSNKWTEKSAKMQRHIIGATLMKPSDLVRIIPQYFAELISEKRPIHSYFKKN
ncbi:MAG: nucleotidyltransferase family protein [Desulfobacteraceae bacterium]|jgi:hypothetical protein